MEWLEHRIAPATLVFELSALEGTTGFKINGEAGSDGSDYSVSEAGDVNGDGIDDLLIGAYASDPNGDRSGASYVVFGKSSGFGSSLGLSALTGANGFRINGERAEDRSGSSVSAAGDVNGDGINDLLIGAPNADPNGSYSGASYVVFGKSSAFASILELSALDGTDGFKINGEGAGDVSGSSISAAGDVDGDGIDDFLIGAPGADPNGYNSGASYVVFGKSSGFSSILELSDLNGTEGFKINGEGARDTFGSSVSAAGDVNGDGINDVLIGARGADTNGVYSGASYVVFGKSSGFASILELSNLGGFNGFKINGESELDRSGSSVSAAGDVNGDGIDDLLIGASDADPNGDYSGTTYVVFGKSSGFASILELSNLDGFNGFKINGEGELNFAFLVSAAGDVNGDGIDDILIGAPGAEPNGDRSGTSYVVFGKSSGFASAVELSALGGSDGFKINGAGPYSYSGRSVSAAGDVNGDGFDDLLIAGNHVVFGRATTILIRDAIVLESDTSTTASFTITLSAPSTNPVSVSYTTVESTATAGTDFIAIAPTVLTFAPGETTKTISVTILGDTSKELDETFFLQLSDATNATILRTNGLAVIVNDDQFSSIIELSRLVGPNGFKINGESRSSYSVSAAGDVNGDGIDDILIGAYAANPNGYSSGASYVVFGKSIGFGSALELSALDGTNGFKINGESAYDNSGFSVDAAGDVNGDGIGDLLIGANGSEPNGASYVVFGKSSGFGSALELSNLDGSAGFKINGETPGDFSGRSVSAAGDVNGDGIDDLLIGAPYANPNGARSGASYVVFGKSSGFASAFELSDLDGAIGFKINGEREYDRSGRSVSAAGDINGDGIDDILIGAYGADPNGDRSGASYVVFGKSSGFGSALDLSDLDGSAGFKINGEAVGDSSGYSVSAAGDVNGDGIGDLLIGAFRALSNGYASGVSYVVFGKSSGFGSALELSNLNGSDGFKIRGEGEEDFSGRSVSAAGDVNGDGIDDLLIGAPYADGSGYDSGASYVVFGKSSAFGSAMELSNLDGSDGFKIIGERELNFSGRSVSAAGDVNGDGIGDILIGAFRADPYRSGSGASYVVFGRASSVLPTLSIGDGLVSEGDSGISHATFTVTLSRAFAEPVSVFYNTVASGSATAGSDFTAIAPTELTFAPGETSKTITVSVLGDLAIEPDETFSVVLSSPGNAVVANDTGVGTIQNDDTPTISIGDATVVEGNSGSSSITFTVSLSEAHIIPVSVSYSTADDSAIAPGDFTAITAAQLDFAPGETSKSITIQIVGDTTIELSETFRVLLGNPVNATIADGTGIGTITNDDFPTISINDATISEGNDGTSNASFTVTLSAASLEPVTVTVATASGSATSGTDFTAIPPTVITFAAGETSKAVDVQALGDLVIEDNEHFSLVLSNPGNAVIAKGTGAGTISNDDNPTISIGDATVAEGKAGSPSITFTVSLSEAHLFPVSVSYATADGTAISPGDFTAITATQLVFAPGETSKSITIRILGDTTIELSETFAVVLSTPVNASIADGTGIGTITNDDFPTVSFTKANDVTITEGNEGSSNESFTVVLSEAALEPVTVTVATLSGTATPGIDFTAIAPTVITFAPGETSKTVNVEVLGDHVIENNETFSLVLSDPGNAVLRDETVLCTIQNDDNPTVSIGDATIVEGNSGTTFITFPVSLSEPHVIPVLVRFATVDGSATSPDDFAARLNSHVDFGSGQTKSVITIQIVGDQVIELVETFSVQLISSPNAIIGDGIGIGTITNDDFPTISIGDASVTEGNEGSGKASFTVTLSEAALEPVLITVATASGTATSGIDFTALTPMVITFAPGETSKTVDVQVLGDLTIEGNETFSLELSNPVNAVIGNATGTGTIENDDNPTISIGDASVAEGDAGATSLTFTATLSEAHVLPVSVEFSTVNGTATAPDDFTAHVASLLNFAPGETSKTITITVAGDLTFEQNETLSALLSRPTNVSISDGEASGTIINDDAAPIVSIADTTVSEGNVGLVNAAFIVSLDRPSAFPVTVSYSTRNGSGSAASDYMAQPATMVTFAPGEVTKTINVAVIGDVNFEMSETLQVMLSSVTGGTIGDGEATGTILNDDAVPLNKKTIDSKTPFAFTDSNGDKVLIRLSGVGTGEVTLEGDAADNANVASIELTGTTAKSSLSVTVKKAGSGDGLTVIGEVVGTGNSALKSLSAKSADIAGEGIMFGGAVNSITARSISTGGVAQLGGAATDKLSLTLGILSAGTTIHTPGVITSFKAVSIDGTTVTAAGLNRLNVSAGNLNADLAISGTVGTLAIKDGNAGGSWSGAAFKTVSLMDGILSANIVSAGPIGGIAVKGGGITGALTAGSFGSITADGGDISGAINATATAETLGKMAAIKTLSLKAGSLTGDVTALGAITKASVSGGELSSDLRGSRFGTVSVSGGSFSGSLTALTPAETLAKVLALTSLKVSNGDITGDVRLSGIAGTISATAAKNAPTGGKLTGATIVASEVRSLTVSGDVSQSLVLAGADLGADFAFGGADTFGAGKIGVVRIGGNITGDELSLIGAGFQTTDGVLNNADDSIVGTTATSEFKSLTVSGTAAEANSYFAAGLFKAVKINGVKVTVSPTDNRFLTLPVV